MKFIFMLLTVYTAFSESQTTKPSSREAVSRANNLLNAMSDTINGHTTEKIGDYVDNKFVYHRCNNKFTKGSSLDLLESFPTKKHFTFLILDAHFEKENLIYKVRIDGFGPQFTALYNATSDKSLRGKYRLLKGEELSCSKNDF